MKYIRQYQGLRKENYILFLGRVVTSLGAMIWPVMTLILNQKLRMNATSVALIMMVAGAVQMPVGLLGGKLADTHNKRNIIIVCDSLSVCFFIICGMVPLSLYSLLLLLCGATLQSMESPAYESLIADINPTKDRERAYSLQYLGSNMGMVAAPTIAGILFANYLWLSFIISGITIGISTMLIFFFIHDITPVKEENAASAYQERREDAGILTVLKENKVVFLYTFIITCYFAAYMQYGYLMPLDMGRLHGELGAALYGTVSSMNCIVVVLFTPIMTHLVAKISLTVKNLMGVGLLMVGYRVFLLGLGHVPVYYIAITLFTWGEILTTLVQGPYTTERIPASHRGRMNSIMVVMQTILQNGMMVVIGILYDNMGSSTAWTMVLAVLGIGLMGNILLISLDKKAYPKLYELKQ